MDEVKRFRVGAAAEYLGVSPRSLGSRGWRLRLGIPCYKVGSALVFDRVALDRWLAKHQERSIRESAEVVEGGAR